MSSQPKILLLGDYSNCHRTLATGLRRLGCNVTQASDGTSWMQTDRQIDITRRPGKLGGLKHYMRLLFGDLRPLLRGYDIVAIHDVDFVQLRPQRMRPLFNRLKRENGSVFLTAMSTDIAYLDMVAAPDCPLRYSEWFIGSEPSRHHIARQQQWEAWHAPVLANYQREALEQLNGAVSVLYEYHLGMQRALGDDRAAYGGLPIDTSLFQPVDITTPQKVKLFLGRDRNRKLMKGSDLLEIAAKRVVSEMPDKAELEIVENIPFSDFTKRLKNSHVVLDQIYSYTPATTALMAMAYGLNTVSGGEPEYYDFIGETENRPIINAPIDLDELTDTLRNVVLNPDKIAERGRKSREFVVKHNDTEVVARRFLDFWLKNL
ncbi:MAG: hypothetical protein NC301_04985 [Bacteroides sp.]|nr:hypothetical protein [Bacteroides sp.]MCM1379790.1 hypothetical protein [Bacteroides sp.]MCM1446149.1 hypothetical protein [Prevotella sp.]